MTGPVPPALPTSDDAYACAAGGLLTCGTDGRLVRVNTMLARWLSTDEETLRTQSLSDLFTPAGTLFFETQLRPLLALGRTVDGAFMTLRSASGVTVPVVMNAVQRPDAGLIDMAMIIVREREQYEATLREAHARTEASLNAVAAGAHAQKMQAVGQMAAGIAHEFNNLLSVMLGHLELASGALNLTNDPTGAIGTDLTRATASGQRAGVIVSQLLSFTGRQIVRTRVLDLNEIVRDASQLFARALGRQIDWDARLAPDLWAVRGAADQMQLVLTNLVLNARDAITARNKPGVITISTRNVPREAGDTSDARDLVQLIVADNGVGMDDETRSRAVDPFFSTKGMSRGAGLGLSMVYGAITSLGGRMLLESTPGVGTRVIVLLPRAETEPVVETLTVPLTVSAPAPLATPAA